jgi:hypothetical protein
VMVVWEGLAQGFGNRVDLGKREDFVQRPD